VSAAQDAVDYSNAAQFKVAVDTGCLTKSFTLTTVPGQQFYELTDDVVDLLAVLDGADPLPYIDASSALAASTATDSVLLIATRFFGVGRSIGIIPIPQDAIDYLVYYVARPAPLTSATELEVQGDFELAVERWVQAMKLEDDGQPELAAEEKVGYQQDLARLRRQAADPGRARVRVVGFDGPE
jgi:hypothetical protein